NVVEHTLSPFLLPLDAVPVLLYPPGCLCFYVTEHVRVPANELVVNQRRGRREVALASLLEQQREEVDLEEEVAELVEKLLVVARERGICDLVRLLDGMRNDRALRLLAVPRTLTAQTLGQALQLEERLPEVRHVVGRGRLAGRGRGGRRPRGGGGGSRRRVAGLVA